MRELRNVNYLKMFISLLFYKSIMDLASYDLLVYRDGLVVKSYDDAKTRGNIRHANINIPGRMFKEVKVGANA